VTRLDHCLRYAVQLRFEEGTLYSQGGFPASRRRSGLVFQRRSPGDTTLSERGQPTSVLQGWHRITTIGLQLICVSTGSFKTIKIHHHRHQESTLIVTLTGLRQRLPDPLPELPRDQHVLRRA
jgi:hypothetical protein